MLSAPLRICLVASSRFPVAEPFMGGLEAHTHGLASALIRRGHRVSLFAAAGSDPALGATALPVAAFSASPTARADVGSPPEEWMAEHHAYLDLVLGIARGRHGPFDVVHNNSLHHLPVAMSDLLAAPVVTTLHTPPLPWLESAMAFAAPTARFAAVSDSVARAWGHAVDAVTLPNGVDTSLWSPLSSRSGGPAPTGRAVWTGRVVPEKAPHEALLAARRAGMAIDLAGPVHDPAYFRSAVAPLLGRSARYLGHLQGRRLRHLVRSAAVAVVSPRWDEPFGLVAAEAMACGTPVAGYDNGALGEIVDSASGVLVTPGDTDALGAAMRRAARLDRAGVRARAVSHFSHELMVERYEWLYRDMASERVGAA
ncbi:MAG: glycosyl transferase family 1 [Marmoricola sp.]|nr:glycosyl transferase family 1 [Marmoricola sp.]